MNKTTYGLRRGNITLLSELISLQKPSIGFHIDPDSISTPRIELDLDMRDLELLYSKTGFPLSPEQAQYYNRVLSSWHGPNEPCVCFADEIAFDSGNDIWLLKARPIDFVKGYLLSMLPRSHAVRSLKPPLIPSIDNLFFPHSLINSIQDCADSFKPARHIYQPLGVRVLIVSKDGYSILQKRSKGANQSYGNALDVTAAGYINAAEDNIRGSEAFLEATTNRGNELTDHWVIGIDRAMKRELREEIKGTGSLYNAIEDVLHNLPHDEFRCFGIERDLRHNHTNFIGFCQIPIELGKWLGDKDNINDEECYHLKGLEPLSANVNRLVAIDLKNPLSKLPAFNIGESDSDRWVHSGLLNAMLTQDCLYGSEISQHGFEFQSEPIVELSEDTLSLIQDTEFARFHLGFSIDASSGKKENIHPKKIFIGHGRSKAWKELRELLRDRLKLEWEEFNSGESIVGKTTIARLEEMLDHASFAFIVMTAEDRHLDGSLHPRENVIHEAGLFQGRLGFARAILLVEEGCEEFSNIHGLTQIRFPQGDIMSKSEEIRRVLEREGILHRG